VDPARIAALLEPFLDRPLTPAQLERTSIYIDLLLRWNARINLTAIRNPEEIVTRHFGESFFLARHVFPDRVERTLLPAPSLALEPRTPNHEPLITNHQPPVTVCDLGSGAGFPGLPVKIWAPEICLTLIESNHKKAAFLREVARALTLTDIDIIAERAESIVNRTAPPAAQDTSSSDSAPTELSGAPALSRASRHGRILGLADVVTFRAVEHFEQTLQLASGLVAPNGRLAILITATQLSLLSRQAERTGQSPFDSRVADHGPTKALRWQTCDVPQSHKRLLALGELAR
jgi:16S rRNA (guanine527-N7)-methyltransferase